MTLSKDDTTQQRTSSKPGSAATIAAMLEQAIIFGRLSPRERLVEDDLIADFATTRHQVRKALLALEEKGLVVLRPHRGAVVRHIAADELQAIYEMRELLHAQAARRMPLPLAAQTLETLIEIQHQHDEAIATDDLHAVFIANNRFHDAFFDACGNPWLSSDIKRYTALAHPVRSYAIGQRTLLQRSQQEHHAIIAAARDGKRDTLIELIVTHLYGARDAYTTRFCTGHEPAATKKPAVS